MGKRGAVMGSKTGASKDWFRREEEESSTKQLSGVTICYTTLFFMYLRPPSEESVEQGKLVAVFYTTVIPVLIPMIYSLRNKDVKDLIKELFSRKLLSK